MKDNFLFLVLFAVLLVMPVAAADLDGGNVDGSDTVATAAPAAGATDPSDPEESTEATMETTSDETDIAPLALDGALAGGYYFVCDCALGYDLKFYVPLEWAHDVFTFDSSGEPVNLSNSTCYAYCPNYPDYTFSCSRFGTFTYRASNYSTTDLNITDISETNITFLEDETPRLSDYQVLILIAAMIFLFGAVGFVTRR